MSNDLFLVRAKTPDGETIYGTYANPSQIFKNQVRLVDVAPNTIERCTGQSDHEGVLIYENDFMRCHYKDPEGSSEGIVRFGHYGHQDHLIDMHFGFFLEDQKGCQAYFGLLQKNSIIIGQATRVEALKKGQFVNLLHSQYVENADDERLKKVKINSIEPGSAGNLQLNTELDIFCELPLGTPVLTL